MQIKRFTYTTLAGILLAFSSFSQQIIPFDTTNWDINAKSYILENYKGYDAIYIQQGTATLKNTSFLNGTVEFDVYLTERQAFPGVYFRTVGNNQEEFYLRPHLPGKPDANQAAPTTNGITAWQLYFGDLYSFPYNYNYDDWTHVKLVVNGDKAQVFLDHSPTPNLSWKLKQTPREGKLSIGGSFAPIHFANFKFTSETPELINFSVKEHPLIDGIIEEWSISDKFDESKLNELKNMDQLIANRTWDKTIKVEENSAANISWARTNDNTGNTVFARLIITSSKEQTKLFTFGYSDRVIAILNGKPIYKGNNGYRTRDYRYLGTIGLFDAIYVDLKKGENVLLFAVSESFGGWGIMGKFDDYSGIKIKP